MSLSFPVFLFEAEHRFMYPSLFLARYVFVVHSIDRSLVKETVDMALEPAFWGGLMIPCDSKLSAKVLVYT